MAILVLINVGVSIYLIALVLKRYSSKEKGPGGALVYPILTGFLGLILGSMVQFLQGAFTFIAITGCLLLRARTETSRICCIVAAIIAYAIPVGVSISRLVEHARLRKMYPVESIAHRLEYEPKHRIDAHGSFPNEVGAAVEESISEAARNRLNGLESLLHYEPKSRSMYLAKLHEGVQGDFVLAQGFGPIRMLSVRAERIVIGEIPPQPVPKPGPPHSDEISADANVNQHLAVELMKDAPSPDQVALETTHEDGLLDFFDRTRMGHVRDRDHVAGFTPHRFTKLPDLKNGAAPIVEWRVTRLELVSLLKHETPVVYVSEYLPQMDLLDSAQTRPLDAFEAESLPKLRRDEDLVVKEETNRIRMLGSIRAAKDCLKCHSVLRGALLGAFSYELMRTRPVREAKRREPAI